MLSTYSRLYISLFSTKINYSHYLRRYESKIILRKHQYKSEEKANYNEDDFFGIMRGDGVKHVVADEKAVDPFRKYDRLMRGPEPTEKVFVTSFGSIRFDSDNQAEPNDVTSKLKSQKCNEDEDKVKNNFENKIVERRRNSIFHRGRRTEELNTQTREVNGERDFHFTKITDTKQNKNLQNIQNKRKNDEIRNEKLCLVNDQTENNESEMNYFDEVCFEDVKFVEKKNDAIDYVSEKKDENLNYFDEIYFGNESISKLENVTQSKVTNIDQKSSNEKMVDGEMNFIDEIYFGKPDREDVKKNFANVDKVDLKKKQILNLSPPIKMKAVPTEIGEKTKINLKTDKEVKQEKTSKNNVVEIVNKYKTPETQSALQFVQETKEDKIKEEFNKSRVLSPVIDIYKEPEYAVLERLINNIIYNDNDIVAINKPYGLPCQDGPKVHHNLLKFLPQLASHVNKNLDTLYPVHRLDATTTGVLLLAKTNGMADYLKSLFKQRNIQKTYWAITRRVPDPLDGIINIPIAEGNILGKRRMVLKPDYNEVTKIVLKKSSLPTQEAVTEYKVIGLCDNASLVEAVTRTGITHQVRVHLGFGLGCPILGDHKYTSITKLAPQKLPDDMLRKLNVRQSKVRDLPVHLHARAISIPEVTEGRNIFIRAELPKHFLWAMQKLKLGSEKNKRK